MELDIESAYHRPLPEFIKVKPDGFCVEGTLKPTLEVKLHDEQVVRKLWLQGRIICQSIDGERPISKHQACCVCRDQTLCTVQLVLYVFANHTPYRIALNHSSAQNYFAYRRSALEKDRELVGLLTTLAVVSHQSWGEVTFTETV